MKFIWYVARLVAGATRCQYLHCDIRFDHVFVVAVDCGYAEGMERHLPTEKAQAIRRSAGKIFSSWRSRREAARQTRESIRDGKRDRMMMRGIDKVQQSLGARGKEKRDVAGAKTPSLSASASSEPMRKR